MYNNILSKKTVSFKEIEKLIYEQCCQAAREATAEILKALDEDLARGRNKKELRDKGYRKTTIKTVYGEVEYSRHAYIFKNEFGKNETKYLLDEELGMDTIGLISTNLAEKIVMAATEVSFRNASEFVSQTTGQTISHGGVWNVIQSLGEKLEKEEEALIQEFHTEQTRGTKEIPLLFEEMDGIWIKRQGKGGRKAKGMEVKIGTMYEGWKADAGKRSSLYEKKVVASIGRSDEFREKWEAKIQSIYDPEKIGKRVLNGDGGNWIYDEYDAEAVQQMDRFHAIKTIRQKTSHEDMRKDMLELLKKDKIEELVELSQIYYDTISTADEDTQEEIAAEELRDYLEKNESELANYKTRINIPTPPESVIYKNMGVQENQNCTVIGLRMKGKRKRWVEKSANNMIKILCSKENRELSDAIDRYTDGEVWIEPIRNKLKAPLSAGKIALVDGEGNNRYVDIINVHLPVFDSSNVGTIKMLRRLTY